MLEIRVRLPVTPLKSARSCSPAAKAAPLQGDDRRFESAQDYYWLGRQPADHLGLEPGMLWVQIPPEPLR